MVEYSHDVAHPKLISGFAQHICLCRVGRQFSRRDIGQPPGVLTLDWPNVLSMTGGKRCFGTSRAPARPTAVRLGRERQFPAAYAPHHPARRYTSTYCPIFQLVAANGLNIAMRIYGDNEIAASGPLCLFCDEQYYYLCAAGRQQFVGF